MHTVYMHIQARIDSFAFPLLVNLSLLLKILHLTDRFSEKMCGAGQAVQLAEFGIARLRAQSPSIYKHAESLVWTGVHDTSTRRLPIVAVEGIVPV